jgi:D-xylono/L-arabinono-1,4-lactonase
MSDIPIEIVSPERLDCGEGPMWDPAQRQLYWTNATGQAIYRYDRQREEVGLLTEQVQAAGIALHEDGGLILGGGSGFLYWNGDEAMRVIADTCNGRPVTSINDIIADPAGRIFGGQEAYREGESYEPGYLFRADPDGSIRVVEEGLHISNGMGFSPDTQVFYLVDSVPRRVYAYDYDRETGAIRNRRTLIQLDRQEGLPDGMTVDSEGFLWIARWFGGGLSRYDPDGRLVRQIPLPVAQPSSVMFGGDDLTELYVTSAALHWESALAPDGHDYTIPRGGPLYRLRLDVPGRPEYRTQV